MARAKKHTCRTGGTRTEREDYPRHTDPGEIVKMADAPHWGRVQGVWMCCGSVEVEFSGFGDQEPGRQMMDPATLADVYAHESNRIPKGYPVPESDRFKGRRRAGQAA